MVHHRIFERFFVTSYSNWKKNIIMLTKKDIHVAFSLSYIHIVTYQRCNNIHISYINFFCHLRRQKSGSFGWWTPQSLLKIPLYGKIIDQFQNWVWQPNFNNSRKGQNTNIIQVFLVFFFAFRRILERKGAHQIKQPLF